MADKNPLTPEEVTELFSEIDASGVLDPTLAKKRTERMREKEAAAKRGDKAVLAARTARARQNISTRCPRTILRARRGAIPLRRPRWPWSSVFWC